VYVPPTSRPAVSCAAGSASFDLNPVREQLLQLPDTTLNVRLIFSTGEASTWRLGAGTVREVKKMLLLTKNAGS